MQTASAQPNTLQAVGVAKTDITPPYPIRLSGFGFRRAESAGVRQQIWAKALAIGTDAEKPVVLIAVDNLGVPDDLVQELARRLQQKAGLEPARLAVTASHTHTAPMLKGVVPTLFGMPIPPDHQEHIDRYTREFTDKLEKVALEALKDRRPAQLAWGIGKVTFAVNRRTKGGPVDHDLPLLAVRAPDGKLRALYVNYACHCVTLSDNKISGDWAGYAQEHLERSHPGTVALCSVGCGADSNPRSGVLGDRADVASQQGEEVAAEMNRLLKGKLRPVTGPIRAQAQRIDLLFDTLPTRKEYEEKAKRKDATGYHARVQLARLDRGEALRTKLSYPVQSWAFGDSLAMVFLPGEVVVDYALRLKRELDGRRLWLNAYANAAPCYIPSERVLKEGGYEGGGAMIYYDQPTRLKPGLEQQIVDAVHAQLGKSFPASFDTTRTQSSRPLAPEQSHATIRTHKDLAVELMIAEPLVISPVAIDFGPDGRLWVAEMLDYPMGLDGRYQPGGRVRVLESSKGDGTYDKATVFLDGIPFPTGITVWRKGVLVCAAPDILYAEDTRRDGKADVVRKLFSGFGTHNYQARVNSLAYGLDGWVHGSCGMFGGKITSFTGKTIALGDRDFRCQPDTGVLEPATGRTQQGRVRDDWGNWFGCDNTNLCRHYPLVDHYLRRNPHVAPPTAFVNVPAGPDPNRLFPVQANLQLFKSSGPPGRTTAGCGLGMYRDDLLGAEYTGNAFTCEPVNLLIHRLRLTPRGVTFAGRRADDEQTSEFLAATDPWFRPVQALTGPDGCLWVVDMYRFVIEHPRWIPAADLAKLDVRAGHDMGRLYRVSSRERPPRPFQRLDRLDTAGLVAALDSPNGWQRDMAGQMLLWKGDKSAVQPLEALARSSQRAEARLHALCVLDGLGQLDASVLRPALADQHPGVRRHAVRLAEKRVAGDTTLGTALLKLVDDTDAQVRLQLAFSLGEWRDPRVGRALASLALRAGDDAYFLTAVLSSVNRANLADVIANVLPESGTTPPPPIVIQRLLALGTALGERDVLPALLRPVLAPREGGFAAWQFTALTGMFDALARRDQSLTESADAPTVAQVRRLLAEARRRAADGKGAEAERLAALSLLGRESEHRPEEIALLAKLLVPQNSSALQAASVAALGRIPDSNVAAVLTAGWRSYSPALKPQILDVLLSRDAWQRELLRSLEKNDVAPAQIDPARRQRLLSHKDAAVRALATRLLAGPANPDRQKVLRAYGDVVKTTGDRERGKAIFGRTCATCHLLHGEGHAVGPDLAGVATKTTEFLLMEILDPNRNVDPRYLEYTAVTRSGRIFTGVLASESATSITLRGQEGREQVLLRSDLEELHTAGRSLMPEGLEKELSMQQMADLIAYLTGAGPVVGRPGS
jgi:putative membrane-bound dehydrogenase-like protein